MPPCMRPGVRCSSMQSTQGAAPSHSNQADARSVVLFGAGSPIIVDVEETCARLGWHILAVIKNVEARVYASDDARVADATPELRLDAPVLLPLFSPANRRHAWKHA